MTLPFGRHFTGTLSSTRCLAGFRETDALPAQNSLVSLPSPVAMNA